MGGDSITDAVIGAFRGGSEEVTPHTPKKTMKNYIQVGRTPAVILSNCQPDVIEERILEIFEQSKIKAESQDNQKYKITFVQETDEDAWKFDNIVEN